MSRLYWINEDENDQISIRDVTTDEEIAVLQFGDDEDRGAGFEAHAERVTACWNALAGFSLEQIEAFAGIVCGRNPAEVVGLSDFVK